MEKLQQINKCVHRVGLFSTNDETDDLPTTSLSYLLVPAYLAYTLNEINVDRNLRLTYLKAAKVIIKFYFIKFIDLLSRISRDYFNIWLDIF